MDTVELRNAAADLENEWKYLLTAAKTWEWLEDHHSESDHAKFPMHTLVFAMDSAFLHGRNLYEFFGEMRDPNSPYLKALRFDEFKVTPTLALKKPWWDEYYHALQGRLSHLRAKRKKLTDGTGEEQSSDINKQVAAMRDELLDLWQQFLTDVNDSAEIVALDRAMRRARHDLDTGDLIGRLDTILAG